MKKEPERISLSDNLMSACLKLSEGNLRAVTVLGQSIRFGEQIDPQSAFNEWSGLIGFDVEGVYGSRIWMLYKDVCKQNIIHTLALLRAVRMGILAKEKLNYAIDNGGEGLHEEELLRIVNKLREELSMFCKSDDPKTLQDTQTQPS